MIKRSINKIHIHPLFWIILGAGIITGHFWEIASVFFIVIVHECGHTMVALWFGWRLESIEILPFGGVAKVNEHGTKPSKEEWLVTLAGPIQHLWLPLFSFFLLGSPFWNMQNHEMFLERNWMILAFNLLPIWPLDGGKVLLLLLSQRLPYQKAYRTALLLSSLFLLILTIGIVWQRSFLLNYVLIALFLVISIYREWKDQPYVFMGFLLERWHRKNRSSQRIRDIIVKPDTTALRVVSEFYKGRTHRIFIQGNDSGREIDEKTLLDAYFSGKLTDKTIGELFT
ncbi:MAG: M50 family metallopeptidase [Tuberibacillus sp.]